MNAWRPLARSTMRSTKYLLESITGSMAVWSGLSVGTGHSANSSPAGRGGAVSSSSVGGWAAPGEQGVDVAYNIQGNRAWIRDLCGGGTSPAGAKAQQQRNASAPGLVH